MDQDKKPIGHKARSPEKLNEYIRIGSSGGLWLIGGIVLIVAALVVWGFVGSIPATTAQSGVVMQTIVNSRECLCFVDVRDNTGTVPAGNEVTVTMADGSTYKGTVSYMGKIAMSAEEVRSIFSMDALGKALGLEDWLLDDLLGDGSYFYMLDVKTDEDISDYWHQIADVTVVLREDRPISFLLG